MLYEGPQPSGPAFQADERQAIFKAIFDLKQEVDALKARLDRRELPPPPPIAPQREEAEWQGEEDYPAHKPILHVHTSDVPEETEHTLSVRRSEEELIRQALEKHHGNRKKAAEELGMSERSLYRKLPAEYRKK